LAAALLWRGRGGFGNKGGLDQAAAQALQLIDEAVVLLDAQARVLDANAAFHRLGGWREHSLHLRPFATLQGADETLSEPAGADEIWLRRGDDRLVLCRITRQALAGA